MIAGYMYWFPKAFGFRLNQRLGRISVACWVVGFYLAFMPLYVLGAAGMARRTQEVFDPAFRPWLLAALCGAFVLAAALATLLLQLYVSIRDRDANRVTVGVRGMHAAWNGRCPHRRQSGISPPSPMSVAVMPSTGASATGAPTSPPINTATSSCPGSLLAA